MTERRGHHYKYRRVFHPVVDQSPSTPTALSLKEEKALEIKIVSGIAQDFMAEIEDRPLEVVVKLGPFREKLQKVHPASRPAISSSYVHSAIGQRLDTKSLRYGDALRGKVMADFAKGVFAVDTILFGEAEIMGNAEEVIADAISDPDKFSPEKRTVYQVLGVDLAKYAAQSLRSEDPTGFVLVDSLPVGISKEKFPFLMREASDPAIVAMGAEFGRDCYKGVYALTGLLTQQPTTARS